MPLTRPVDKAARVAQPLFFQRKGNRRPLGEVLQRHAQRKRQRAGEGHGAAFAAGAGRKPAPRPGPPGTLCRVTASTSMVVRAKELFIPSGSLLPGCRWGRMPVQREQEQRAQHKAACRGQPGRPARLLGHFHGGYQKRPDRGGDHHAGGKAQKRALHAMRNVLFEEEHRGRAQRRGQKGKHRAQKREIDGRHLPKTSSHAKGDCIYLYSSIK